MNTTPLRIHKYLAMCGTASRRKCEDWVRQGRVFIDGAPATLGQLVLPGAHVTLNGQALHLPEAPMVLMLHKPRGFVTTMQDPHAKRCVADLITGIHTRLFPVGRLDKNSEGLLLMTNNGALAHKLTHPSAHVSKTYAVTLHGSLTGAQQQALAQSVLLDGKATQPMQVSCSKAWPDRTVLQLILHEGRNRQIRRICALQGLRILRLKRIAIGNLTLGTLPAGQFKDITAEAQTLFDFSY